MPLKNSQIKGFAQILILLTVVVAGVIAFWFSKPGHDLAYLQEIVRSFPRKVIPPPKGCYYQKAECVKAPCDPVLVCPHTSPTSDASREPNGSLETANWRTYTSENGGFTIKYPSNWEYKISIEESSQGNVNLQSSLGMLQILWETGFGGKECDQNNLNNVTTSAGIAQICDLGLEGFGVASGIDRKDSVKFYFKAIIDPKYQQQANKDLFLRVLSTFKFTQ